MYYDKINLSIRIIKKEKIELSIIINQQLLLQSEKNQKNTGMINRKNAIISKLIIYKVGNKFNLYKNNPHQTIIKSDRKYMSIAAASELAKTY